MSFTNRPPTREQKNVPEHITRSLDNHNLQTHLTEGVKIRVSECTEFILFIFLQYFILCPMNKIGSTLGIRKKELFVKFIFNITSRFKQFWQTQSSNVEQFRFDPTNKGPRWTFSLVHFRDVMVQFHLEKHQFSFKITFLESDSPSSSSPKNQTAFWIPLDCFWSNTGCNFS